MSNKQQKQRPRSQQGQGPKRYEAPSWQVNTIIFCMVTPAIFLVLYLSGAWDIALTKEGTIDKHDGWDSSIKTAVIMFALLGFFLFKGLINQLETAANAHLN